MTINHIKDRTFLLIIGVIASAFAWVILHYLGEAFHFALLAITTSVSINNLIKKQHTVFSFFMLFIVLVLFTIELLEYLGGLSIMQ